MGLTKILIIQTVLCYCFDVILADSLDSLTAANLHPTSVKLLANYQFYDMQAPANHNHLLYQIDVSATQNFYLLLCQTENITSKIAPLHFPYTPFHDHTLAQDCIIILFDGIKKPFQKLPDTITTNLPIPNDKFYSEIRFFNQIRKIFTGPNNPNFDPILGPSSDF